MLRVGGAMGGAVDVVLVRDAMVKSMTGFSELVENSDAVENTMTIAT